MFSRRKFLNSSMLGSLGIAIGNSCKSFLHAEAGAKTTGFNGEGLPVVLATWKNEAAVTEAWHQLSEKKTVLDAVEAGVKVVEADPNNMTVGIGGRPDRDGHVTLDACIMDSNGNAGAVCFLEHIKHPVSVARRVMENTPHVLLAGEGALAFALSEGFKKENLLTEKAEQDWKAWLTGSEYKPIINIENHDTIGMLAIDANGDLAGACTTSGLGYKLRGRVGDSPIIGAGLFVDNEVGAAAATGLGESVLKTLGSFLVVELMRQGKSPQEACEGAVMRIVKKQGSKDFQVGFIALNKQGQAGAYSIHPGFDCSVYQHGQHALVKAKSYLD